MGKCRMKKFSFKLEPVLKYKNDRLEMLKNEHAKIVARIVAQEEKIAGLENDRHNCEMEFNERKKMGIIPIEAVNFQNYLDMQDKVIKKEQLVLKGIQAEEERKKEEILEAKKESLTIERLKEINLEQYRKEEAKENENFIEEFVSNARAAAK